MKLQKDEQETLIYQNASNSGMWYIYTDNKTRIREYKKKGLEFTEKGQGIEFVLPDSQLTIRKKRKELTKEQKLERKRRLEKNKDTQL